MISKEKLREIVKKSVEEVWYNRRSFNPVEDQTELITEAIHQALSMSGVGDSVPCDYRKAECTNEGNIIKGVWKCSNHQGTDH